MINPKKNKVKGYRVRLYDDSGRPIADATEQDVKKLEKRIKSWFKKCQ